VANSDSPTGLSPVRYLSGAPYNGAANLYYAPATYDTNLFIGDPVVIQGTSDSRGYQEVNKATAGATNRTTGVIVGFLPNYPGAVPNLNNVYGAASTLRYILVADDPTLLFAIQADGTYAQTDVGLNANYIFTNAGNTATGLSGVELNTATDASDATFQMTTIGLLDTQNNEFGEFAKVLVRINLHTYAPGVAGVA
jgi:hypothetical protein